MRTPPIPPTDPSEITDTPAEEFAQQESDPAEYRGTEDEIEQAPQRPTGSGGSADPTQRRGSPPE